MAARGEARTGMSDHGWDGGDWPDDLDPDSGGGGDLGPDAPDLGGDLSGDLGSGFGEAETADLGGFDPMSDGPDDPPGEAPDHTSDVPLDPAGDSAVDLPHAADGDSGTGGDPATDPELTPVGADPDLDAHADGWTDQPFPEPLDLDAPEPVDGFPWTDPATLGGEPLPDADAGYQGAPEATELASYAGEEIPPGADPWTALSASEDPATSNLARWWAPGT
jgi:hypothetical protein